MHDVLYLQSEDIVDLASIDDYIDAIRDGYRQMSVDGTTAPRTKLFHNNHDGMLMYYGALLPESGVMGTFDYVGEFANGDAWFLTFLADANTGDPLAIIDSSSVNPLKTGATGALGVDTLAYDDASTVGVVGTGAQAKGQLLAAACIRDLTDVAVFSPTVVHRRTFAEEMDDRLDANVYAVDTANTAVQEADIVVTATTSSTPVFDGDELNPGAHVTAMGQSHPERRELDAATVARARYVPDLRSRAMTASGELLGAIADGAIDEYHVHADLGEVLAGVAPGRTDDEQVTVFDSGGTGVETVAALYMVYQRAVEAGRGIDIGMMPGSKAFEEL